METCMYRRGDDGEVISRIFAEGETIPTGWVDTPAKLKEPAKRRAPKAKADGESA